jgi:hypothetical protein
MKTSETESGDTEYHEPVVTHESFELRMEYLAERRSALSLFGLDLDSHSTTAGQTGSQSLRGIDWNRIAFN